MPNVVGGGGKKVLYTLDTVRRIGLRNSAKALKAKNACKACGLGMGGQLGGMTNEKQEFPSVCNKSIQAQSTDIQQPIPSEVFQHPLSELRELSAKELEHLGRLGSPIFKARDSNRYKAISWDEAINIARERFNETAPAKSFFYSSGRSSNEAGFILQLLARLYGTNNVNNCSFYCHQATGVGLKTTIGKDTSTVELADLEKCDLFFLIGANPASNHPRLIHQLKHIRDRGGDVVVINPAKEPGLVKFAVPKSPKSLIKGGDYIASYYLQPKIASDLWLFKGIAKAVITAHKENIEFINLYTKGFEAFKQDAMDTEWNTIEQETGLVQKDMEQVAKAYINSSRTVFAWGMGMTHHLHGSENVEYIANLALLRGMVGKHGAGLLPLRGHSNVQGIGTIGVKPVLAEEIIDALEKHLDINLPNDKGMDTLACLEAAKNGDIQSALVMGGNLYSASPDSAWTEQAMDNIGFKLSLTTTLNQGHIYGHDNSESLVLPVAARDEESEATTQESMFNYVRMSDGGISRLDNIRSESEILVELGTKLVPKEKFDFNQFNKHSNTREAIAKCIPGMEDLKSIDVAKKEFHIRKRLMHKPKFTTPDKHAHFVTHPSRATSESEKRPFTLMTIRSEGQFNSIIYEENDSYRSVNNRQTILMNKQDIVSKGLSEGDYVKVTSDTGAMNKLEVKAFDLPRGNIMAYYPEANVLVGRSTDPRSKTPSFKAVAVCVTKVPRTG